MWIDRHNEANIRLSQFYEIAYKTAKNVKNFIHVFINTLSIAQNM
jgi:hypothetical protein